MKIILKENATDKDMVEIITLNHLGPRKGLMVWGVVHVDFLPYNGWQEKLSEDGEITCEISLVGNGEQIAL